MTKLLQLVLMLVAPHPCCLHSLALTRFVTACLFVFLSVSLSVHKGQQAIIAHSLLCAGRVLNGGCVSALGEMNRTLQRGPTYIHTGTLTNTRTYTPSSQKREPRVCSFHFAQLIV